MLLFGVPEHPAQWVPCGDRKSPVPWSMAVILRKLGPAFGTLCPLRAIPADGGVASVLPVSITIGGAVIRPGLIPNKKGPPHLDSNKSLWGRLFFYTLRYAARFK